MKGDIARTAEPNWPKGYSRPCIVMPKKKLGELAGQCSLLIRDCLGMCHWVVSSCVVHHLICILSQHCNKFPFLFCPVKLFISTHQFNIFFRSFPHPTEGDEGKWLCGVQLPAGINHNNHSECIFKYQILFRNTKGDKYFCIIFILWLLIISSARTKHTLLYSSMPHTSFSWPVVHVFLMTITSLWKSIPQWSPNKPCHFSHLCYKLLP